MLSAVKGMKDKDSKAAMPFCNTAANKELLLGQGLTSLVFKDTQHLLAHCDVLNEALIRNLEQLLVFKRRRW